MNDRTNLVPSRLREEMPEVARTGDALVLKRAFQQRGMQVTGGSGVITVRLHNGYRIEFRPAAEVGASRLGWARSVVKVVFQRASGNPAVDPNDPASRPASIRATVPQYEVRVMVLHETLGRLSPESWYCEALEPMQLLQMALMWASSVTGLPLQPMHRAGPRIIRQLQGEAD